MNEGRRGIRRFLRFASRGCDLPFAAILVAALLLPPAVLAAQPDFEGQLTRIAAQRGRDAQRFQQLLKVYSDHLILDRPEVATAIGAPGHNARWSDRSLTAVERRQREPEAVLRALRSIQRSRLAEWDRLNYNVLQRELEEDRDAARFPAELMPVHRLRGPQLEVPQMLSLMPRTRAADYRDVIGRLRGVPLLVDQTITLMQRGTNTSITPPRAAMAGVEGQLQQLLAAGPDSSPLLEAFRRFPDTISDAEQGQLRAEAASVLTNDVRPALERLRGFVVEAYAPVCRESIALGALPDGEAWYAVLVRRFASTSLSPREIHELGQREMARIRMEMESVMRRCGFAGALADFMHFLRTDPRFFPQTREELLAGYRDIAKRVDPELPRLFGRLPRLPYGIRAVPEYSEQTQPTAYYIPGSPASGRAGSFFVNTWNLASRPKWEMEALVLHEAVPGHHLQVALTQEIENLPDFRKRGRHTAFAEGWALYAEGLGETMGFYADPYQKFGQLTFEWWRAARLVVDTGIHAFGWSREQAIEFLRRDSAQPMHEIEAEVDRYIAWPGQALAYKIGELKFKELRAFAARELGEQFEVRRFHDAVLAGGPLPLDLLEARMKAWVVAEKKRP